MGDGEYKRKTIEQFEAALAIYTELDDRTGQALMLQHLGHCSKALRQPARAAQLFERALAMQAPRQSVFTNEKIRSFYHPESFLRACRPYNEDGTVKMTYPSGAGALYNFYSFS